MELIIALVLFAGLIGCWLMLPGSATSSAVLSGDDTSPAAQVTV